METRTLLHTDLTVSRASLGTMTFGTEWGWGADKDAARTLFDATCRFHHPAHAEEWKDPDLAPRVDAVLTLLLKGLDAPRKR